MSGILEKLVTVLTELSENTSKHNDLLLKIIAAGPGGAAADKPAGTRGRKPKTAAAEDEGSADDDAGTVDINDLDATVQKAKGWLKEFAADGDNDPENDARTEKFHQAVAKLGLKKLSDISKEADRKRADEWIDKMIEKGRITGELPKKGKAASKDDEEI